MSLRALQRVGGCLQEQKHALQRAWLSLHHEGSVQAVQVQQRSKKFMVVTDCVASGLETNEELLSATAEAGRTMRARSHLIEVVADRAARRKVQAQQTCQKVVALNRLRDIVIAQVQELAALTREKSRWIQRSFPSFRSNLESHPL